MYANLRHVVLALMSSIVVAGCGGGGSGTNATPPATGPTNAERAAAATATANNNARCSSNLLGSYYWEIGDKSGVLVAGAIGGGRIVRDTVVNIASGSKWPFAAYVVQKYGDLSANVPFLNFTSGYSNFDNALCSAAQTVAQCNNGVINSAEAGARTFHYQGGHMQQLAVSRGLGALTIDTLAAEVNGYIGNDVGLAYVQPQPAGGARASAASYAVFLRKLLADSSNPLQLGALLGSHAVCTQPSATCNASTDTAAALPENFHYSLGHWVEDDPTYTPSSNFAYSSAGSFGFYPWVDFDRKLYGIIAREDHAATIGGAGYASLLCGRLIRLAWKTGTPQ
jgi:hypothetical protein